VHPVTLLEIKVKGSRGKIENHSRWHLKNNGVMFKEKQRKTVRADIFGVLGLPQTFEAVIGDLRRIVFRDLDAGGFHAVVCRAELS